MSASLPADLHLLLTDRRGRADPRRSLALAAGVLAQLAAAGRVDLDDDADPALRLLSPDPIGDPVADQVLRSLGDHEGTYVRALLDAPELAVTAPREQELRARGLLEPRRTLRGEVLRPTDEAAREVRERWAARLADVLDGRVTPALEDAAMLAILDATGRLEPLLPGGAEAEDVAEGVRDVTGAVPSMGALAQAIGVRGRVRGVPGSPSAVTLT